MIAFSIQDKKGALSELHYFSHIFYVSGMVKKHHFKLLTKHALI